MRFDDGGGDEERTADATVGGSALGLHGSRNGTAYDGWCCEKERSAGERRHRGQCVEQYDGGADRLLFCRAGDVYLPASGSGYAAPEVKVRGRHDGFDRKNGGRQKHLPHCDRQSERGEKGAGARGNPCARVYHDAARDAAGAGDAGPEGERGDRAERCLYPVCPDGQPGRRADFTARIGRPEQCEFQTDRPAHH